MRSASKARSSASAAWAGPRTVSRTVVGGVGRGERARARLERAV